MLDEGERPRARSVGLEDLGNPGPEHDRLGEDPRAEVLLGTVEDLQGEHFAEEVPEIGEGFLAELAELFANLFELTAAGSSVKFRRNSRQEWVVRFHTLALPHSAGFFTLFSVEDGP